MGNPLLDIVVHVEDDFLDVVGIRKAEMRLVSKDESARILGLLHGKPFLVDAGGGAANTVAGLGLLGGVGAFMGMVGEDENAQTYEQGLKKSRVDPHLVRGTQPTGYAITFITPDGERTFATYLGSALGFREEHLNPTNIQHSAILHIEGYQLEGEQTRAAEKAMQIAKKHRRQVAISLADTHLIHRTHKHMRRVVEEYADIVFLNEQEAQAFTRKTSEDALSELARMVRNVAITRGDKGSTLIIEKRRVEIPAVAVHVENTNGAGDMYAAGMLYALLRSNNPETIGNIASWAAAQVVSSPVARAQRDLRQEAKELFKQSDINT